MTRVENREANPHQSQTVERDPRPGITRNSPLIEGSLIVTELVARFDKLSTAMGCDVILSTTFTRKCRILSRRVYTGWVGSCKGFQDVFSGTTKDSEEIIF